MKLGKELFILVFFVGLLVPNLAITQNSIGLNFGFASYQGDLHRYGQEDMNLWNSSGLSFGLYGKRDFGKYFNARIAYQFVNFKGDDQNFELITGHPNRNFSFNNTMHELTAKVDLEPFKNWNLSPFISAGAGIAFHNPNTVFDTSNKTNVQLSQISEDQENLRRIILAFPVGLGFNVHLTEKISLGTEVAMRMPVSDYLDGVSSSAFSEFNDYFGTGVVNLTYKLESPKPSSSERITSKDQNLAEQMINVHPPSGDPGDISPISPPSNVDEPIVNDELVQEEQKNKTEEVETRSEVKNDLQISEEVIKKTASFQLDSDNDGLIDKLDDCPLVFAKTANGCPKISTTSDVNCSADFGVRTIQFETSFSELSNQDRRKLNDAVDIMEVCPNLKLIIEGHTDSRGSEIVNQTLSEQRANAVKLFITSRGIDSKRIRTFGFGENQPIADNNSEDGRSLNRRVVVSFF